MSFFQVLNIYSHQSDFKATCLEALACWIKVNKLCLFFHYENTDICMRVMSVGKIENLMGDA